MAEDGIDIDDLCIEIENRYQNLCQSAALGGGCTLDELADVVGDISDIAKLLNLLMGEVIKLQDEVGKLKTK